MILEEKLEDKVLKKIDKEDLSKLAVLLKIKVPGFRDTGGKIPEYLVKNAIKKYAKNVKKDFFEKIKIEESTDEKLRLMKLTKILVDAINRENLEAVEEFIKDEEVNVRDGNRNDDSSHDEREEVKLLKEKLAQQEVENKKIKREFRKEKERLEKEFLEEKKRLKEKIKDGLSIEEHNKVVECVKKFEEENNTLKDKIKEYDRQIDYIKIIINEKTILLIDLNLKERAYFPYKYYEVSSRDIVRRQMPDASITDVWIIKDSFSDIHYTVLIDALEKKYGSFNIFEIDRELMRKLKMEVQQ